MKCFSKIGTWAVYSVSFLAISTIVKAQLPAGKGKDVVERTCNNCHNSQPITSHRMLKKDWADTIEKMRGYGANATDDEADAILDYLATHMGKLVNINKDSVQDIQDGLYLSPKDAEAIVKYRQENGTFKQLTDLSSVPGIDIKKIQEQQDNIVF